VPLPMIPGHEFAGEVAQVGDGVTGYAVGDRVTAPFACGCGRCEWCASGNAHVCPNQYQPGFTGNGSFAEFVMVPAAETNLVRLPDSLSYPAAAALGCRFATSWRAVKDQGRLQSGEILAVFGCGGVGLAA
ncbi:MAG TPA: alcohol dehydrogenase, partial [Propionibacteriaceae bacterium]|nr:alcohol dehydrogenase [Propionibacteriaceae bacterium]